MVEKKFANIEPIETAVTARKGLQIPSRITKQTFILKGLINPYPTAFPYGNGMVLPFYQQQESSTTKTVHKVINKGLKTYVPRIVASHW